MVWRRAVYEGSTVRRLSDITHIFTFTLNQFEADVAHVSGLMNALEHSEVISKPDMLCLTWIVFIKAQWTFWQNVFIISHFIFVIARLFG